MENTSPESPELMPGAAAVGMGLLGPTNCKPCQRLYKGRLFVLVGLLIVGVAAGIWYQRRA